MWQFTQAEGLSDKYEWALEMYNTYTKSPANIPNKKITGTFHRAGGIIFRMNFLIIQNRGLEDIKNRKNIRIPLSHLTQFINNLNLNNF